MNRPTRLILPLVIPALLAACAGVAPKTPSTPPAAAAPVSAKLPAPPATESMPAPAAATDVWDRLRRSFAMPDCNADPSVLKWANRYTRNHKLFEQTMRQALPRLDYVQQVASQYDVPGEFVLLPWVESHYRPAPGRRYHSAGMWQIMPITARSLSLQVNRHYDGRFDIPAATHAVMKLLEQYHEHFKDWRMADYAYNTGEFKLRKLVRQYGSPADEPVIPDLPVPRITREHLIKLLAIACVVREPDRFHVHLPLLPDTERLVQVPLPRSMTFARAAELADMPIAPLKQLNSAFHGKTIDTAYASYLILPSNRAERFRTAAREASDVAAVGPTSPATTTKRTPGVQHQHRTHVVKRGESLWQIAHHNATSVAALQQLNNLKGHSIQPGEVLQLDDDD